MRLIIVAAFLTLTAAAAAPPPLAGAARVLDGDTVEVAGRKVRLIGMDAPEGKQVCQRDGRPWRCGDEAKAVLVDLIGTAPLRCEVLGKERWGRALAVCHAGSSDVGREMVRRGLAVAYYPARGVRGPLYDAEEAEAEVAQMGLWSGAFIRPADWRKGER